jgi:putative transposase
LKEAFGKKQNTMKFEKGQLYHIFNRGNNREKIFYSRENYLFFLSKIKTHVSPYCDIIAWCLMPNHFHLMVCVKETEIAISEGFSSNNTEGFALSEALGGNAALSEALGGNAASSEALGGNGGNGGNKIRTLNQSIGIMLRSYTNAIQKQENRTGSLFQKQTKAILLQDDNSLVPAYFNTVFGTLINTCQYRSYADMCFTYIHTNPCAANLVEKCEDWEFSSYADYVGIRNGKLVNKELGNQFFLP